MKRIVLLTVLAVLAVVLVITAGESLKPLFLGIGFAYIFTPAVKQLEEKGFSRRLALICVYVFVTVLIFAVFRIGVPYLISGFISLQKTLTEHFTRTSFAIPQSIDSFITQFGTSVFGYIGNAAATLASTVGIVINIALGLVLSFYMILDSEKIKKAMTGFIPVKGRPFFSFSFKCIDTVLKQFLIGQLGVSLVISVLLYIGLSVLRIKYAMLLALVAGLFEIIPYFGGIMGAVPAVIIALSDSVQKAVWTGVLFFAVQQLEGAYISPKILGNYVGLHPIITIMAVIVGGHLFGFWGMFFAVPVCGIARCIVQEALNVLCDGNKP